MAQLCIISSSLKQFNALCYIFRIEKDQVRYIDNPEKLRGIHPNDIVIFSEGWYYNRSLREIEEIEYLVKSHNIKQKMF
jgi:hypothetical protein